MNNAPKLMIPFLLLSYSVESAPLYFNSTEVIEAGTWDWNNKGYIIGGGDGNYGNLTLKGSSGYNHSFNVGVDGGDGFLNISESAKNLNKNTYFSTGTVSNGNDSVSDTKGTINIIGPGHWTYNHT
ncbi:hypothetical protein ACP3TB_25000 (plasmid) [Rahnella variigena]|uniref:hypothetical protein n=1 Tax=Rahnella variigena TaxID=574964 RepID=UPI003CF1CDEE